ncbi:polysaccharide biosynthesis C-terminal domain-containing protein [Fibrella aquatilis]|uniref:Polysaccharide biosynthesis C-terminal domain-containing protein n=1 Tax=Fibrella aquatilis TaxID=2817059 RepID=A0A939G5R9_9BACT|nr:oligosaccharide flippase family protein [Fibrella aquatilis]MBO0932892.1 polysaccharide biosynthesis C-terminal domain-containing protein [Fibrella aquatilis]
MSAFKKLAGDTALYGISTIAARSINFLLVPIQTYAFKKGGTLSSNVTLYAWVGVLLTVYTLGLETAFFRYAARNKGPENEAERARVFSRTLSMVVLVSVVATALILLLTKPITTALGYPGQELFIQWTALLVGLDAIMAIPFARLRVEGKAKQFVVAKLINIGLNVLLNVFFIVVCKDITEGDYLTGLQPVAQFFYRPEIGPGYILLANLLANAFYFLVLRRAFSGFQPTFDWPQARLLLIFALPIMFTNLASVLNNLTDRLFLREFLPNGFYPGHSSEWALDVYGQCFKLSVFISLAIQSFKFAAEPFFFGQADDKNAPDLLARVTKWFIVVCVVLWVGISLNMDLAGRLLNPERRAGLDVVPLLMLGNLLLGIYYNISFWFKLSDKTKFGTLITVVGLAITFGLNWLLIPQLGYMGCAWAFLASSFVMMALCYVLGERYYPVPYNVPSAVGYVAGGGLLIYLNSFIHISNLWVAVPFHVALFGLFLGCVLAVEWTTVREGLVRLKKIGTQKSPTS